MNAENIRYSSAELPVERQILLVVESVEPLRYNLQLKLRATTGTILLSADELENLRTVLNYVAEQGIAEQPRAGDLLASLHNRRSPGPGAT